MRNLYSKILENAEHSDEHIQEIIKFLIDDENEAIRGYNESLGKLKLILSEPEYQNFEEVFHHIIAEEGEHIKELTDLANSFSSNK